LNIRKITSLIAALSFVLMLLTSIILYIVPQGRVAYWADWRLWGLTKTDWGNIHINLGLLFLISLGLHIYYNWKLLISYLKNRAKKVKVFTPEFNTALVITLAFAIGTYFLVPPFGWVMALNDHLKETGAAKYGEPPYGHAELSSLKTFTRKLNLDLGQSMTQIKNAGYRLENEMQTLAQIAQQNGVPPQKIYEAMRSAGTMPVAAVQDSRPMPDTPPPGTGNLTLADVCQQYGLNMKVVKGALREQGISVSDEMTLKAIGEKNGIHPTAVYEAIQNLWH
jgi:hypothetical protein